MNNALFFFTLRLLRRYSSSCDRVSFGSMAILHHIIPLYLRQFDRLFLVMTGPSIMSGQAFLLVIMILDVFFLSSQHYRYLNWERGVLLLVNSLFIQQIILITALSNHCNTLNFNPQQRGKIYHFLSKKLKKKVIAIIWLLSLSLSLQSLQNRIMFQNPDYAHSRIIAQVLTEEKNRIEKCLAHLPCLEKASVRLVDQMASRHHSMLSVDCKMQELKGNAIEGRQQARRKRANLRKEIDHDCNFLEKAKNRQRFLKKMLKEEQEKAIAAQAQEILLNEQLQACQQQQQIHEQQQSDFYTKYQQHKQQKEIGSVRIQEQNLNHINQLNLLNEAQAQIKERKESIALLLSSQEALNAKMEKIQERVYEEKVKNVQMEQAHDQSTRKIQILQQECQRLRQKIGQESKWQRFEQRAHEIEQKLQKKKQVCQKIEGDLLLAQTQSGSLTRDNKLSQHKIQCIQMLINVLYGCRDQMIDLMRNPKSSRYRAYQSKLLLSKISEGGNSSQKSSEMEPPSI